MINQSQVSLACGDVVQLNGQPPRMCVREVNESSTTVDWFDGSDSAGWTQRQEIFPTEQLFRVPETGLNL